MSGDNSDSDLDESSKAPRARSLALDLGDDCLHNVDSNRLGSEPPLASANPEVPQASCPSTTNPFSFKHFLRENSNPSRNYQSQGARPKIYREHRPRNVTPPESPRRPAGSSRRIGEFSSALPDFVQDHLVIEQCFLGTEAKTSINTDIDLPDFAQNERVVNGPNVSRANSLEDSLTGPIPLDLPGLGNPTVPFDLPLSSVNLSTDCRTTPLVEVGNSKSLPDFLTDGPVRTAADGATPSPPKAAPDPPVCRRCAELSVELAGARQRITRAEDIVEQNYQRASSAERTITKLKQELKTLKIQMKHVEEENMLLKSWEGAAAARGGGEPPLEARTHRLAQELKAAASTAEHSLRSLLTGVDNLRIIASTLENFNRIEEKPRFSHFEDDSTGPAL
ncbi:uncharacterized protein LOC126741456 [Anthonomus grandis grandis]|uniref:uncharacterized protein LOC126741456 n=1 Tax=Anthonomus grandis grandis TaxID=2921223 RepID=UPI0021654B1A|nr:uncharacterized protein LOC126741456 [Anthonomus grandis grandis]